MKIKLDENLPSRLGVLLKSFGHDVHTTYDEGLIGGEDKDIWEAAQKEARFLITQDLDFSDTRKFAPGSHHGILLVRLRSPSRGSLVERIGELFRNEIITEWHGCFVVSTERKIRVLKPSNKQRS
jgi:predicted nuclease of predicted toxin-antitoxin system